MQLKRRMRQLAVEHGMSAANGQKVFQNLGARDGKIDVHLFVYFVRSSLR